MNTQADRQPGGPRRYRRALPLLAALALPLSLVATEPATAAQAATRMTSAPATTASNPTPAASGLPNSPEQVTLISGDQVTLTPAGQGRYSITAKPARRVASLPAAIAVNSVHHANGHDTIFALPIDAQGLISAGRVDRGLFDVTYLASHEAHDTLPVVIQYTTPHTHDQLVSNASRLPASSLIQTLDSRNAVEVNVDLRHAGAFWAALTGRSGSSQSAAPPALAGGIAKIWLKDHTVPSQVLSPASEPLYTVTETIDDVSSQAFTALGCFTDSTTITTICAGGSLTGVEGSGADQSYNPTSVTCIQTTPPCHTAQLTFTVPAAFTRQRTS